jgi:hypothetical protein
MGLSRWEVFDAYIVIISGSTNGYIAEELLNAIGQKRDFTKDTFFRGANVEQGIKIERGNYSDTDIVIYKGTWLKDKTIFNVAPVLGSGDIVLKGANAIQPDRKLVGIQIANPSLGTSGSILQAVIGRRTQLIIPVGLEKRIWGNITEIAAKINSPSTTGLRILPIGGTIITELEAIHILTGASAELVAAGGILGSEGSCWIAASGTEDQLSKISHLIQSIIKESNL